ncbi:MAG: hypothetical protein EXS37_02970 [Opitutus sp.]|nr:hypothetical protein [Opitutus sp.]
MSREFLWLRRIVFPLLVVFVATRAVSAEHTLFAFDGRALPFQTGVRLRLDGFRVSALGPSNIALAPGPSGSPDRKGVLFYGSVCEVNGEYWMWYLGLGEPEGRAHPRVCFARSKDGRTWAKPTLNLADFGGNRQNNLVEFSTGDFPLIGCVVLYDPEGTNPERRFKMIFEAPKHQYRLAVAYSSDGLRWQESPGNPRGPWLEPCGLIKRDGTYYLNGQGKGHWAPGDQMTDRVLVTHISYDFDNWTQPSALGFRRDAIPPRATNLTGKEDGEQVHLGASLWNRGNVIVGIYGQWHGHPSNDRRLVGIDLGLLVSHDALSFQEPIPDFPLVSAREITWDLPYERAPALMQGQAFANIGGESCFWYSVWGVPAAGIRLAKWPRDRLGYLQPFGGPTQNAEIISEAIAMGDRPVAVSLNVAGLNDLSRIRVAILDEQFRELPGYRLSEFVDTVQSGLRQKIAWSGKSDVTHKGRIRVQIRFGGARPEDVKLYAIYLTPLGRS